MDFNDFNNQFKGLNSFMDSFNKILQPFAENIKIVEQNMIMVLQQFAERLKPIKAFLILSEHQFTYWKPLCNDDIKEIIASDDVDMYLAEKINDKSFIDYDVLCCEMIQSALLSDTNKSILSQSIKAIELGLYDLALVGIITVFDGALSIATNNSTTSIKSRLRAISDQIDCLTDEQWEDLDETDITAFGMYITWSKSMKGFQLSSNFSEPETEPQDLNRHWIAHGRKTTSATKLDCCKMINALYGLIYFGDSRDKIGKEDEETNIEL